MPQRNITGPVVDSAGVGLASGELHITPVVPAGVATDGFVVQTHVHSIANGKMTAPVVVPGTYRIDLFDGDGDRLRSFTANVGDASLAPITLKEVWEERSTPVDLPPADLREGDSILRLSPGGGLCGQVLQQHGDKLRWGDMQCGGSGSGDMKAQLYDPSLRRSDVYNRANHTGTQPHTTVTGLGSAATKDVGSTNGTVAAGDHTHANATTSTAGFISVTDKIKLDGIQTGATANLSNEYLLDRTHHTGTQSYTTVTGLGDAATKNVGTGSGDVAAGNHTHSNATTSTSGFMSSTDKTKLDGVASGATANATDADLRDRSTHTGTQAISTVTNLQTTLDAKADLVGGKIPTGQLPAIAINDVFTVGSQAAMVALTAQRGDIAVRTDEGKSYVLSTDDPTVVANWVHLQSPSGGVTSVNGQTGAVTLVAADIADLGDAATKNVGTGSGNVAAGNHSHSNATTSTAGFMSSTDKTKLDGVASGATANATDAQLRDRSTHTGSQAYTTITGLGDSATKNVGTGSSDVAAGNHTHSNATTSTAGFMSSTDKAKLDGVAAGATANAADADLRDRSTHTGTQAISTVTNLQTTLDAKADLVGGKLSTSQLPALAINDTYTVASQTAMLALTAQRGDLAIRSDQSKTYVLADDDPTILANWVLLQSPAGGAVSSVNGMTGAVTLAASDVGAASSSAFTSHTSNTSNPHAVTAAQAGAVALTGNETVAGNKSFSGEILPGSNVRFYGSAAATTNTSNIYHQYASGIMTLRLWTIGNTIAKVNGFEVVNNDFGSQSTYIRGYILGKQVFQSHSAYSGANADNPDFWVKTRLYVEHSAMPDTQPNVLIRLKTGQTGDAIKVVDQSDALVWNIDSSARASFKKLNISTSTPPSSPTAAGKAGDVTWDSSYFYVCTADNSWKKAALGTEFSQGGTVSPTGGVASPTEVVIWRAPYACTVKSVNGYRKDGAFAVVNARKTAPDGTQTKFLSSDLNLPASGQWFTAGAGTMTMAAGDTLEIMVVAASGSPSQVAIQVDFER